MALVLEVFQVVAPVFFLALIGLVWVRAGWAYDIEFVTRLSMTVSVPCLIFVALMNSQAPISELGSTFAAAIVAYLVLIIVTALLIWTLGWDQQTYLAPLVFGNTGNLGLPLALFAFGQAGFGHAVVVFSVMAFLSFSFGVWVVSGGGSIAKTVKEPMVWATILGALFLINGWQTPLWMTNSLDLIGQIAIPMMLITLGVAVARLRAVEFGFATGISLLKATICILVGYYIGLWFELSPLAHAVLVLQLTTPVAVTSYLLAQKYGADAQAVAGMVVASTLCSVIILPIVLGFAL